MLALTQRATLDRHLERLMACNHEPHACREADRAARVRDIRARLACDRYQLDPRATADAIIAADH